jgi:Mce-associated membrane protein
VEDKQPAAGDLTEEAATKTDADAAPDSVEAAPEQTDGDEAEQADNADAAAPEKASEKPRRRGRNKATAKTTAKNKVRGSRPKRLTGRRVAVAVSVAATLLFVGSAAFAGASLQPYLSDRATVAIKLNVARTAANAIALLWTYTPDSLATLPDRAQNYLTGDFAAQYRKYVDALAAPNKQAQISNNTVVTGAAVESLDGPNAVAIVYTNTTTTSPLTKNIPSLKYLSYRLTLKRDHERWRVTWMTTVTSLEITPHL